MSRAYRRHVVWSLEYEGWLSAKAFVKDISKAEPMTYSAAIRFCRQASEECLGPMAVVVSLRDVEASMGWAKGGREWVVDGEEDEDRVSTD